MQCPKVESQKTYPEIVAGLNIKERNELKRNPFALSIALTKEVLAGRLGYRSTAFMTRWPLYGSGNRREPARNAKREILEVESGA